MYGLKTELLRLRLNALVSTKTIYMMITNNGGLILSPYFIRLLGVKEEVYMYVYKCVIIHRFRCCAANVCNLKKTCKKTKKIFSQDTPF